MLLLLVAGNAYAEGVLRYAGATTLQKFFMPEVARIFSSDTAIKVSVEGGNTGPGIRALLKGEVDMAGAGRLLTDAEKEQGLVEHFLGWDVLSIVVHKDNLVGDLSVEQLQGIFSGSVADWKEVGGSAGPILVVTCPKASGMRSAVKKLILKDKDFLSREVVSAIVAEADQQVSMFSVGITALSKSMVDAKNVKSIKVNGVTPTAQHISDGKYPLAKPLTLVTMGEPQGDLVRFLDLVKSEQGKAILRGSFVPVN
jgi:phosphate transport system substrate-binding protein